MVILSQLRFAKINLDYDKKIVENEILSLKNQFTICPVGKKYAKAHPQIFVGTEEEINEVTVTDDIDITRVYRKKLDPWYGFSLTHIPGNLQTKVGSNFIRNSSTASWIWRDDISAPYIRKLVEFLNFKELHSVRILLLPANSIGLVHQDSNAEYYRENISLTLNIKTGNSSLVFLKQNKNYHVGNDDAFLFRDDCLHGIPKVSSDRLQIRINGKPNQDIMHKLVDFDTAIMAE